MKLIYVFWIKQLLVSNLKNWAKQLLEGNFVLEYQIDEQDKEVKFADLNLSPFEKWPWKMQMQKGDDKKNE